MKILLVSLDSPYPANDGARIRTYNLLQQLSSRHQVDFIGLGRVEAEAWGSFLRHKMMLAYPSWNQLGVWKKIWLLGLGMLRGQTAVEVWLRQSPLLIRTLQELEQGAYDAVILEFSYLAYIGRQIKLAYPQMKVVIDAHNVEYQLLRRMAKASKQLLVRWQKQYLWRSMRHRESELAASANQVWAVSELDQQDFALLNPGLDIQVVPNGVDVQYFQPDQSVHQPTIVFCGMMSYQPNEVGIMWFVDQAWPTVRAALPQARLQIVGKGPSAAVQRLAQDDQIEVTGQVADVRPYAQAAKVVIVPLRSGGGTRLKVVEAMAMAKTIVSTSVGAEGIVESPGIIRADQPEEFAAEVIRLYQAPNITKLGQANLDLARQHYSWEVVGQQALTALKKAP